MPGADPSDISSIPPGLMTLIGDYANSSSSVCFDGLDNFVATGLMCGLAGNAYCTYTGAGLNQYMVMLAATGSGKDNIQRVMRTLLALAPPPLGDNGKPVGVDFRGPGYIASAPALMKALSRNSSLICNVGEFHGWMLELTNRRNVIGYALGRLILEAYNRSGLNGVLDPTIYADSEKNIAAILRPSLTLVGEGTIEGFYRNCDAEQVGSGLVPRFDVHEYAGDRRYSNPEVNSAPPPELANGIRNLVAYARACIGNGRPHVVPVDPDAHSLLDSFDTECTDGINAGNEVSKQLWNRAHLKALKLATVSAISQNIYSPSVHQDDAAWAITQIRSRTAKLIAKFDNNEVGNVDGDELKQLDEVLRAVGRLFSSPFEAIRAYGGITEQMHQDGIVTETYLQRVVCQRAAFRNDKRLRPSDSLKKILAILCNSDELREMPVAQIYAKYGVRARAFVMADTKRFLSATIGRG